MRLSLLFLLFFAVCRFHATAQEGYRIDLDIVGYEQDTLLLAYHLADKQYILDTAVRGDRDRFVFSGDEPLEPGMYLAVMRPDNRYFQLLITDREQRFEVKTTRDQQVGSISFRNAPDNRLFYDYLGFLNTERPKAELLQQQIAAETSENKKAGLQQQLDAINEKVTAYQEDLVTKYADFFTAAIVNANLPLTPPEYDGTPEEVQEKKWRWMQQHYFDNLDLTDERLLRTPFFFQRIDYFVNKLQVQHPDSISRAIDRVLGGMDPKSENFRVYLIQFLNQYAAAKLVGMDAVYVHLVDNYYRKGLATWTEEEQLQKILDNADKLRPLLIGKTAPDIKMQRRDGSAISLHEVDADFTVLYFWRYDCGHCKKMTPYMKDFYEQFAGKGVEIFSVCVKFGDDIPGCWEYVDENELNDWIQVVDPYLQSRFNSIYDVRTTPQIYVLDRNKGIVSKSIGAEQLPEVMEYLLKQQSGS